LDRQDDSSEFYSIGIDLGGTKIAAALVSFPSARIVVKEIIPTLPTRGGEIVLKDTIALAEKLKSHAASINAKVRGIGVGIAELVNRNGEITSEYSIKWKSLPAKAALSRVAPAEFDSDARTPAYAEARFGAGAAFRNFVYLTVGTGISHCLVLDGRPYRGAHGHAIICGSGILSMECENCGSDQKQVLEQYAAGPSLVARYNQNSGAAFASAQEVVAAARSGDKIAAQVVRSAAVSLGNTAGFLINILDPEALIVGGGLGLSGGLYWSTFTASTREHIWSEESRDLPILKAGLGADAGIVGAAALIWEQATRAATNVRATQ
jgi:glucokinase